MPVELVNKDPRYSKVHLIDHAPLGYLRLAAEVQAAHRPGPVLSRSRDKQQLFGVLKWQARQLAGLDAVERVTVYDAVVFAPPGGDVKDRPATLPAAWFDVAGAGRDQLAGGGSRGTRRSRLAGPRRGADREGAPSAPGRRAERAPGRRWGQDPPRPVPVQLFRRRRPCPGRRGVGLPSRLV